MGIASCAALGAMLGISLFNLATAPRLERAPLPRRRPRVSLLVPARNEAETLRATLPRLLALDDPALEILVLDDHSTDGTAETVTALAAGDPRVRVIRGAPLPPGWLGKCWACHQLGVEAGGECLIFCDADVYVEGEALRRTLGLLEEADAVTALPRQRFGGWAERAAVPLVAQLPVVALLPLRLVGSTRSPALSMANGQWIAFRREAYERIGGHAAVRDRVVEDVALGRNVKASGGRLVAALAPRSLGVRMYDGAGAVREGFGKNLYPLVGGHPATLAAALALYGLVAVYPWAGALLGAPRALPALALLLGVRTAAALCCGHGWREVLLHPAGSLLVGAIGVESALRHRRGTTVWKGRTISTSTTAVP